MNLRQLVMSEVIKAYKANRITKGQLYKARRIRFPTAKINILGTSTKVQKNLKRGFLTSIVYLAPSSESIAYFPNEV